MNAFIERRHGAKSCHKKPVLTPFQQHTLKLLGNTEWRLWFVRGACQLYPTPVLINDLTGTMAVITKAGQIDTHHGLRFRAQKIQKIA